ncbi:ABC-type nitrate/sulfonate/bicarbonate transport system permease component [Herbihabitans rhizosphaerae]|uniref:ABC-type nitrate/sulfonate/bicarbonate transport system permease component n=1 Tax=Herbihabitans rhizosphaerae TaxID=1872711 RepID=A0A4Q7KVI6_9PSEU|nr:ABC transporter permease [Herbihabitans rhizosphaerae]RZS41048.1 ABC-type nitrate/sulfonate/bicarbonate transport system permease component [Herbihabitans rhizosphaerae]
MRGITGFVQRWALFVLIVLIWEVVTRLSASPFFPPPSQIGPRMVDLWLSGPASRLFLTDTVYDHLLPSVGRTLLGWAIAAVIGIGLGLLLGRSTVAMRYLRVLLDFGRAIPPPLMVPFFLVTLGLGAPMQLGAIVFGAVWPVLLNSIDGARSVDATKVDTARAFRLSGPQWMGGVVLPAALPKIFAGLRLSISIALILMVVSELVASTHGLGNQLVAAGRDYDMAGMWAYIVLLGILGYAFNIALLAVEHRVLRWQPGRAHAAASR